MIFTIVYFIVALLCFYPFSKLLLDYAISPAKPEAYDIMMSCFFGALAALFWPIGLLLAGGYKISKLIWEAILGEEEKSKSKNRR